MKFGLLTSFRWLLDGPFSVAIDYDDLSFTRNPATARAVKPFAAGSRSGWSGKPSAKK
jgi:hypothetical protein